MLEYSKELLSTDTFGIIVAKRLHGTEILLKPSLKDCRIHNSEPLLIKLCFTHIIIGQD